MKKGRLQKIVAMLIISLTLVMSASFIPKSEPKSVEAYIIDIPCDDKNLVAGDLVDVGTGSSVQSYHIYTAEGLKMLSDAYFYFDYDGLEEIEGIAAILENDIYVEYNSDLDIIFPSVNYFGNPCAPFVGIFDGNQHIIEMETSGNMNVSALFGRMHNVCIKNLRLDATHSVAKHRAAGVVDYLTGSCSFDNVYVSGDIEANSTLVVGYEPPSLEYEISEEDYLNIESHNIPYVIAAGFVSVATGDVSFVNCKFNFGYPNYPSGNAVIVAIGYNEDSTIAAGFIGLAKATEDKSVLNHTIQIKRCVSRTKQIEGAGVAAGLVGVALNYSFNILQTYVEEALINCKGTSKEYEGVRIAPTQASMVGVVFKTSNSFESVVCVTECCVYITNAELVVDGVDNFFCTDSAFIVDDYWYDGDIFLSSGPSPVVGDEMWGEEDCFECVFDALLYRAGSERPENTIGYGDNFTSHKWSRNTNKGLMDGKILPAVFNDEFFDLWR